MGWLFSKYHSGFEVIFQISYGEWGNVIRKFSFFLSIIMFFRLFLKYNKVNRELSFGEVVIF
jgi:hypothetical protein